VAATHRSPFVVFFGFVSRSSEIIYGEPVWSPIDLLGRFPDDNPSKATWFGVWFISFAFIIAQLGTNISANSISNERLVPRFIVRSILVNPRLIHLSTLSKFRTSVVVVILQLSVSACYHGISSKVAITSLHICRHIQFS
jgi:hypothetical protein